MSGSLDTLITDALTDEAAWADLTRDHRLIEIRDSLRRVVIGSDAELARARERHAAATAEHLGPEEFTRLRAEFKRRRADLIARKEVALSRLRVVKRDLARDADDRQRKHEALAALTAAVIRHQESIRGGAARGEADQQLWELLDEIAIPHGPGELSLREAAHDSLWRAPASSTGSTRIAQAAPLRDHGNPRVPLFHRPGDPAP